MMTRPFATALLHILALWVLVFCGQAWADLWKCVDRRKCEETYVRDEPSESRPSDVACKKLSGKGPFIDPPPYSIESRQVCDFAWDVCLKDAVAYIDATENRMRQLSPQRAHSGDSDSSDPKLGSSDEFSGVAALVLWLIAAFLMVVPLWRIFQRAGFNPILSVLVIIPWIGFLIVAAVLGFAAWPNLKNNLST